MRERRENRSHEPGSLLDIGTTGKLRMFYISVYTMAYQWRQTFGADQDPYGTPRVSPISHAFAFGTVGGPVREGHGAFISL